tara:strand:+ start:1098 stop:1616 length:519 start_codon:yes stop_codon:yes gene_type:complete
MSVHSFQNMISFTSERNCMWDKYRHESKQTICIIGVLILSAKLCRADGHFSEREEEEILKIVPHETQQKKILVRILEEAYNDPSPIEHDARNLKALLEDEHLEFLEFIVAALYKLAHTDHIYSEAEDEDIRSVANIFGITKGFFDQTQETIKNYFDKATSSLRNRKKEKINA